jgi:hypothetical protein
MGPINKLVEKWQYNNAKFDIFPFNIALSIGAV